MEIGELTCRELKALVNWDGEDIFELIENMKGIPYDLAMDENIELNFTVQDVFDFLNKKEADSIFHNEKEIKVSDVKSGLFGEKMLLNKLIDVAGGSTKKLIEMIPVIVSVYAARQVAGNFDDAVFKRLQKDFKNYKVSELYPIVMSYIAQLANVNKFQSEQLKIDFAYQTKNSLKMSAKMANAGLERLDIFGDMNLIDDFIELFPIYKHDEVFNLDYVFVIDRLKRNMIKNNITELTYED